MIEQLLMQVISTDLTSLWAWFTSSFWVFISSYGVVIGAAIIFGIYFIRKLLHDREPTTGKIGIYDMRIPHMSEEFSVTVYDLAVNKNIDRLIHGLISVHKDDVDQMNRVAALLHLNRNTLHFYLGKYKDFDKSTRKSGYALIATNAALDDGKFYREKSSGYDKLRGELIRSRIVSDADFSAWIKDRADVWEKRYVVDFIYYPLRPLQNVVLPPTQIRTLEIELGAVAQMKQMTRTFETSRSNEIEVKASREAQRIAETGQRKALSRADHEARQRLKKTYWQNQLTTIGTPMSLAIIALVLGGSTIGLFDPLSKWFPGYQMWQYVGGGFAIGLVLIWLYGRFMNPQE